MSSRRSGPTVARATVSDVAALAGVSPSTVSNSFNRPETVAEATKLRIQSAVDRLGFVRNPSARSLRTGRTGNLGLIVHDISNPFFTEVIRGAEDVSGLGGYSLLVGSSDGDPQRESHYLRSFEEQGVDGVILDPVAAAPEVFEPYLSRGMKIVLVDILSIWPWIPSVSADGEAGAHLAIRHLIERGHRRIAFINGPVSFRQGAERRRGVISALVQANLDPKTVLTELALDSVNWEEAEEATRTLVATSADLPSAIFCANDYTAYGALRGIAASGLSVPGDISVVGFDDLPFSSMLATPLTTVRQPQKRLGSTAARLMLDELGGHVGPSEQIRFQPELIVRESTKHRVPVA